MQNIVRCFLGVVVMGLLLPFRMALGAEPVQSKWNAELYGFLWTSFEYKSSESRKNSDVGGPAIPGSQGEESKGMFTVNVRPTRLGVRLASPDTLGAKNTGLLEIDFRGDADEAEGRNPSPRMRHAYWQLAWPMGEGRTVRLLAGQTWHFFFPPGLEAVDFAGGGGTGYLFGGRITQLRLGFDTKPTKDSGLSFDVSLIPPLSSTRQGFSSLASTTAGVKHNAPFGQGRITFLFPLFAPNTKLEVAGSIGREKQTRPEESVTHYAGQFHLSVPFSIFTLSGAIWAGQDITNMGGLGVTSFTPGTGTVLGSFTAAAGTRNSGTTFFKGIEENGGWIQLAAKVTPKVTVSAAYGVDNVDNDDLRKPPALPTNLATTVTKNQGIFSQLAWAPDPSWEFSTGYNYIWTNYLAAKTGDDNRITFKVLRYF